MLIRRCKCHHTLSQTLEIDDLLTIYLLPAPRQLSQRTVSSVHPQVPGFPYSLPLWYVFTTLHINTPIILTYVYSSSQWE